MSFTGSAGPGMEAAPGYQGPPVRSTSGLAIATLIVGIAGFLVITIPVNLILGIVALTRTGRGGHKGRGLAVAGLVLSVLWGVGIGILATSLMSSSEPKRDNNGQITAPQAAGPDKLRVGDCVARSEGNEVTDVQAQPCGKPGSDKVYAIFNLPGGPWPGLEQSNAAAEKGCTKRFDALHKNTDAELVYFAPTETRWKLGYHRVVCLSSPAN
jgi:Domain of unknown function (DUF4190)/Septum formation